LLKLIFCCVAKLSWPKGNELTYGLTPRFYSPGSLLMSCTRNFLFVFRNFFYTESYQICP